MVLVGTVYHSTSVSPMFTCFNFISLRFTMSDVSEGIQAFIDQPLADNNQLLLNQITKLVSNSDEKIKRSSSEAADERLPEIKKLRLEEHRSFNRKGNEIQYKLNFKVQGSLEEVQSHLEMNAVDKAKEALVQGLAIGGLGAHNVSIQQRVVSLMTGD